MNGDVLQALARAHGRDPRPRGAGARRRPRHPGPRLGQPCRSRLRPRERAPAGRRPHQEPLRRADVHPARPGAAQARPADEVQPAAGDRRRQAARRRRRLDRARQHDPPDRPDAARRGRQRGPHADLRAADRHPCFYGIDMSTREEMVAHGRTTEEVAAELGCDSLAYISLDGVYEAVRGDRAQPLRRLLHRASTRSKARARCSRSSTSSFR